MKKSTKTLAAAALAISALTPVAAASAASSIADGVYTSTNYYSIPDFKKLSTADKAAALTSPGAVVVVGGTAYTGADVLSASDSELPDLGTAADTYTTEAGNKLVSGQKLDTAPVEAAVASVSAINATTVEVTFNTALETVPAASEFSIPGIEVKAAAFKPETDNKVVVLTTSTQSAQNYTLTYGGKNTTFVGKTNLGSVLLTAEKYEVEIKSNENKLTPVEITAQLAGFPEGAEAVIEFTTSFGKVVKVQTTQNGKAVFQLTPLETLTDQTAVVTGKVVEVKNPTNGETYPEFKNSSVGSVNVKFIIKDDTTTGAIQSFKVNTSYADQADRVYLKVSGGISGKIQEALEYQPAKLIETTDSATKKEMYRHLHDVMYSNIQDKVNVNATTSSDVATAKAALKDVFKDITAEDLRNLLYQDAINTRAAQYAKLGGTNASLYNEVKDIPVAELEGILSYYRLLSKFVILNDIKDTAAPQQADNIFTVEHAYSEGDALVLVLPTDRSQDDRDYTTQKYNQDRDVAANFLKDNASHQVLFVNDTDKDRYEITGDPTFKLEDATSVKLMAVQNGRYKVQQPGTSTGGTTNAIKEFCEIPGAVVASSTGGITPPTDGGTTTTPGSGATYTGGVKLTAKNFTISDIYRPYDIAEGTTNADKLGEIKVVFSESVSLEDATSANSILNKENWTINGIQLTRIESQYNVNVDIRMTSTDAKKQLRDVAVLTFSTNQVASGTDRDLRAMKQFVEKLQSGEHKLEVRNIGDWAAETDSRNNVPTQSLDFAGLSVSENWAPNYNPTSSGGGTTSPDVITVELAQGNAFITRVAGTSTTSADMVHILFSEPMKFNGTDSVLEKANYRLDGIELPVNGSSIKRGLVGVTGFEDSLCGVTIELPSGYLQQGSITGQNILTVSNVKGYSYDAEGNRTPEAVALDERVQLAYARQYTIIPGAGFQINGAAPTTGWLTFPITSVSGPATAEGRIFKDASGNVVNITNWFNVDLGGSLVDFFTTNPTTADPEKATK